MTFTKMIKGVSLHILKVLVQITGYRLTALLLLITNTDILEIFPWKKHSVRTAYSHFHNHYIKFHIFNELPQSPAIASLVDHSSSAAQTRLSASLGTPNDLLCRKWSSRKRELY